MNSRLRYTVIVLTSLLGIAACAPRSGGGDSDKPADPKALVQEDLAALGEITSQKVSQNSTTTKSAFTKVFGGSSGTAVRSFMDTRIKYYLSPADLNAVRMSEFVVKYDGWQKDPDSDKRMKDANAVVGASNVGTGVFYLGVINQQPITLYFGDKPFPVDSPRVGIMLIGEGYVASVKLEDGRVVQIPASRRQAILVHEARHSDCTGGLRDIDLEPARSARSSQEYTANFKRNSCGHLHVYCPEGHDFAGLPACDNHAWGAYTVGAIFQEGLAGAASGTERLLLEAGAIDSYSRLIGIEKNSMLRGEYGEPDMSSKSFQ